MLKVKRKGNEKMATFYNQATLIFDGSSTTSNVTEGELLVGISGTKTALTADYVRDGIITYGISIVNSGAVSENNITVTDNLGSYTPVGLSAPVTPLEYIDGSVLLYINGSPALAPTVTLGEGSITFSGINLAPGENAFLIYETRANEFAPLASGDSITNTASIGAAAPIEAVTDTATVPVRDWTSLTIAKAVCPGVITDNGEITYTFIIQNTGNTPADATDNVVIADTFAPILSNITVTLDGTPLTEGVGYTYNETTGEFRTIEGAIPVPAATFTQNSDTGAIGVVPGVTVITVTGTV